MEGLKTRLGRLNEAAGLSTRNLGKQLGRKEDYFIALGGHKWASASKADAVSFAKSML